MNHNDFRKLRKGVFYPFRITRPAKVRASFRDVNLIKVTKTVGRVGIRFSHLGQSIADNNGEIVENPLAWGQWSDYPFYIRHRDRGYCRLYANMGQTRSNYLLDGKVISKDEISHMLLASELTKRETPSNGILTLSVKEENLELL